MACYAVKCLTVPGMPNNEGAVAPIRVSAPQDSILNAHPPYPTGGRHVTGHMVAPLVFRTLAGAVPGHVQADCGMMNIVTFQGTNPGGQSMSTIYFSTGGFGEPASRRAGRGRRCWPMSRRASSPLASRTHEVYGVEVPSGYRA